MKFSGLWIITLVSYLVWSIAHKNTFFSPRDRLRLKFTRYVNKNSTTKGL